MTDIEIIRLLIADTTAPQHFTDAQLQAFLDMEDSVVLLAAARALEAWAASLSKSTESEKIGDYGYTKKAAANKIDLAKQYRESYGGNDIPALGIATLDLVGNTENQYEV